MVVKKEIGDLSQFLESLKRLHEVVDLHELDPELKRQWADAKELNGMFKVKLRLPNFRDPVDAELRLPPYSDRVEMHIPFRGRTQSDSPIIMRIAAILSSLAQYDEKEILEQYREWEYAPYRDEITFSRGVRRGNPPEAFGREQGKDPAIKFEQYARALNNITNNYMSLTPVSRRS